MKFISNKDASQRGMEYLIYLTVEPQSHKHRESFNSVKLVLN